ncbi:GntR family transcriptional regulator [Roseibium sp.]|uniref:GntR family transcriptional regulator n=1 Tax=Roseibium sp. TaxID=1936156 RepID=UPI003A968BDD
MTLTEGVENPLKPPKGARKSWTIYQALKRRIVIGDLTYDSPITEQALACDFSCSQGTVREALLSLQEDGLVDRRGYQGTFVTRTSDEEATLLVRLRLSIECSGMERAVPRISAEAARKLRAIAELYLACRAERDIFACAEVDRAFHMNIFKLAEMPMLEPILKRTLLQLHRFTVSRNRGKILWRELKEDPHTAIVEAMARRDAEQAKTLLAEHIAFSLSRLAPEVHSTIFPQVQSEELNMQLA